METLSVISLHIVREKRQRLSELEDYDSFRCRNFGETEKSRKADGKGCDGTVMDA